MRTKKKFVVHKGGGSRFIGTAVIGSIQPLHSRETAKTRIFGPCSVEKYVQKGLHSARASKTLSRRGFSFYFSVTSVTRIRVMVRVKVDDALRLNLHNHVDDLIN